MEFGTDMTPRIFILTQLLQPMKNFKNIYIDGEPKIGPSPVRP